MSRTLTASDRKALIRLASDLPKRSEERRTLLAMVERRAAPMSAATRGQDMMSAASQARLLHKINMKQFVDVYEEVGMNLIRLEGTKQILKEGPYTPSVADEVAFLEEEIDKGMKFLRSYDIKAMSEALENMTRAYDLAKKVLR